MEKRKISCPETRGFSESSGQNRTGGFLLVLRVWWMSGHRRLFLMKGRLWVSLVPPSRDLGEEDPIHNLLILWA